MAAIMGRPTDYTQELADKMCALLATGTSLNKICKRDDMPEMKTFFNWIGKYADFLHKYKAARDQQADYFAEECVDISDETEVKANYKGEEITLELSGVAVQRNRLRMDSRKWYASKLNPRKYGDKTILSGDDEHPLIAHESILKQALDAKKATIPQGF